MCLRGLDSVRGLIAHGLSTSLQDILPLANLSRIAATIYCLGWRTTTNKRTNMDCVCRACGVGTTAGLCVACQFKIAAAERLQRRQHGLDLPAHERGDRRSREGWEEMENWERANRSLDGKALKERLDWLAQIRNDT